MTKRLTGRLSALTLALAAVGAMAQQAPPAAQSPAPASQPWMDSSLPAAERAHLLVQQLTLDEKANQLNDWAPAIPRLGLPDYQTWNEALHGVARSGYATVFPQAIGMAATWNPAMMQQVGDVISTEARAKFNDAQLHGNRRIFFGLTFWSPNINIFRDPRWGRGQETYGEDPFLTGQIANGFIKGIQGPDPEHPKAVATSKHFAVHSGPESQRHTFNVDPSPRDLEETYLPAFRTTVVDGHVKSLMCAYNAIDGKSACANTMLLKDHLRDAWHFNGFVVSDCGAIMDVSEGHHDAADDTHASAISVKAGTDLACTIWRPAFDKLGDAVRQHLVNEDVVTEAAERVFTARFQLGLYDAKESEYDKIPMSVVASDSYREIARKVAESSLVLLKNENNALPLAASAPNGIKSIAVVGPTADLLVALEGNYNGQPLKPVTPLDGIRERFSGATVNYAQGASLAEGVMVPVPRTALPGGLRQQVFASVDTTGRPVADTMVHDIQYDWADVLPAADLHTHDYSVRWTGKLRVPAAGSYALMLDSPSSFPWAVRERYRFMLDGKVISEGLLQDLSKESKPESKAYATHTDVPFAAGGVDTMPVHENGPFPAKFNVTLSDTNDHDLVVEYSHSGDQAGGGLTLSWQPPAQPLLDEAVAAAKNSDVVVAFTGLSPQLEGEEMPVHVAGFAGGDRTSIDLPASQVKLLEAVAATGKPVVVVNLSGSAIALNWAKEHAAAVVQAWYPGVEGGTAIARTLAGDVSPAGRLPVTFYASTTDLPPFTDYSMKNRTYRYYNGTPLWGFGYGQSYTTFSYGTPHLSDHSLKAGKPLTVTVAVKNTGRVASDEVVEAYLKTPQAGGPTRSLVGFQRVHLAPGESRDVQLNVTDRSLSSVTDKGDHVILPGRYQLSVGSTQPGTGSNATTADFTVQGTVTLPK